MPRTAGLQWTASAVVLLLAVAPRRIETGAGGHGSGVAVYVEVGAGTKAFRHFVQLTELHGDARRQILPHEQSTRWVVRSRSLSLPMAPPACCCQVPSRPDSTGCDGRAWSAGFRSSAASARWPSVRAAACPTEQPAHASRTSRRRSRSRVTASVTSESGSRIWNMRSNCACRSASLAATRGYLRISNALTRDRARVQPRGIAAGRRQRQDRPRRFNRVQCDGARRLTGVRIAHVPEEAVHPRLDLQSARNCAPGYSTVESCGDNMMGKE